MIRNNHQLNKRSGLTLIELIIYISITMIVLVVIVDLVIQVAAHKSGSVGQNQVSENARFLFDKLTYQIESASAINGSYPQNNLSLTVNGSAVNFTLSDGQIFLQEGADPASAITESNVFIEPISGNSIFNKVDNGAFSSVEIKYKVTYSQANYSREFHTTVTLKGK